MKYESVKGVKVSNYLLRYIVPFSFEAVKEEETYTKACVSLATNQWRNGEFDKGESDCFSYMKELYTWKEDGVCDKTSIGSIWRKKEQEKDEVWFEYTNAKTGNYAGKIKDYGMYLMKNKIGLFWYEIEFAEGTEVELDGLINFQNRFKELASRGDSINMVLTGKLNIEEKMIVSEAAEESCFEVIKKDKTTYKISSKAVLGIVDVEDIKEISLFEQAANENGRFLDYKIKVKYPLGVWIKQKLEELRCNITFYPWRTHTVEKTKQSIHIPDKSILFLYLAMDSSQMDDAHKDTLDVAAYYLTEGYKATYKAANDFTEHMEHPFENIVWNVEKEGCGIFSSYTQDNKAFLTNTMFSKIKWDYFHLYMNLLQQSYVLLNLADEIATTLSANTKDFAFGEKKTADKLESLETRINVFLMKNVYASVSHIGHHNRFYAYVEKKLNIKEDIQSLHEGVAALDEIQRRRADDKVSIGVALLSLLSVVSLFEEVSIFIGCIMDGTIVEVKNVVGMIVTFLAAIVLFMTSKDAWRKALRALIKRYI